MNNPAIDNELCLQIIRYLNDRIDHQDDLEGILLGVYEQKIAKLSDTILRHIQYLLSIDGIKIVTTANRKTLFKLSREINQISKILRESTDNSSEGSSQDD